MKKQIIVGASLLCVLSSVLAIANIKDNNQNIKLASDNIQYKDTRQVAINVSEDGENYVSSNTIPTGDYMLNEEKSKCRIPTDTQKGENAPADNNVTISYEDGKVNFRGLTTQNTKCYIYFDKIPDSEDPVINSITASNITKTSFDVTVDATDNKEVTEYWYALDSGSYTKGTGSSYTFSGLTAGKTYTVKVKVVDASGNYVESTKDVTTTPEGQTSSTIIADITGRSEYHTGNPTFTNVATNDEGIYSASDGMYGGTSYYWRGAATTNHVIFANMCWRIVRINGDGTMRLIYNGSVLTGNKCTGNGSYAGSIAKTSQTYNPSYDRSEYVGYTYTTGSQRTTGGSASNLKTQTDSWYNTNIGNNTTYASKVADGKFCNDRNTGSGYSWSSQPSSTFYYAGYDRSGAKNANTVNPTLACPTGDVYTLKAGAITMDEVVMAGAKWGTANSSYYLYNGQYYWTMSPSIWDGPWASVFYVPDDGQLSDYYVNSTFGLRPVINLKANTMFATGGIGTTDKPYAVQ